MSLLCLNVENKISCHFTVLMGSLGRTDIKNIENQQQNKAVINSKENKRLCKKRNVIIVYHVAQMCTFF